MMPSVVRASKFMSYVLRHRPDAIGLTLDSAGWAAIDELVRLSQASECPLSPELITEVVRSDDKQGFRISDDGSYIRASQGHSVAVDLALAPREPPTILFHGTATRFLASILRDGLRPGSRQHVHRNACSLSINPGTGVESTLQIAQTRPFSPATHVSRAIHARSACIMVQRKGERMPTNGDPDAYCTCVLRLWGCSRVLLRNLLRKPSLQG